MLPERNIEHVPSATPDPNEERAPSLRGIFPHEALDFTPWLQANIAQLSACIGRDLRVLNREFRIGSGSCIADLLCQDADGNRVVIENQFEWADNSHLGAILTYLANLDATVAVWIAEHSIPETRNAVRWLNRTSAGHISFYLVHAQPDETGVRFTTIVHPNDTQPETIIQITDNRRLTEQRFWEGLLEKSRSRTHLFSALPPIPSSELEEYAGYPGLFYYYDLLIKSNWVQLHFYFNKANLASNRNLFEALREQRSEVEREFGGPLDWDFLPERPAARIVKRFKYPALQYPDKWPKLQDDMIEAMITLDRILQPRIAQFFQQAR